MESYLSVFGLEEIVFSELSVEWIPEDGDETVGMQSGYSLSLAQQHDPAEPLSDGGLARCIIAANAANNKTAGLAHFRVALANLHQQRYIETIRHAYLCLEQLFANGKHQKNETIKEFKKSKELTAAITNTCFSDAGLGKYFDRVREKHEDLAEASKVEDILKFLFRLRGELQHAKPGAHSKWHPSRQHEYEVEALFLVNLAYDICSQMVVNDMQGVPIERK